MTSPGCSRLIVSRVEALQLDAGLELHRLSGGPAAPAVRPTRLWPCGACPMPFGKTTVVFSRAFCGTMIEKVERTGPSPIVTLMQAAKTSSTSGSVAGRSVAL